MTLQDIENFLQSKGFGKWYHELQWKKHGAADMDNYPVEQAYMYAKYDTPFWDKNHPERVEEFNKICNIIYPNYQDQDGRTHINVYSKGKTRLGQFLSNFTKHPIQTEDGKFDSIEGYWYFLNSGDEKLRTLSGWAAKSYGRQVKANDWNDSEEFKRKICAAIKTKIITSNQKTAFTNNNLALDHYYDYSGKLVRPEQGRWILEYMDHLKVQLRIQQNEDWEQKRAKELHDREYKEYLRLKEKFEKT